MQVGPPPSCPHRRAGRVNDKKVNEENSIKRRMKMGAQKNGYEALYPRYAPVGYNIPLLRPKYKGFLKKSRSDCIKNLNSEKRTNQVGRFLAKLPNTRPCVANKNCLADADDEKAACPSKRRGSRMVSCMGENGKKGACSHCGKGALVQTAGAVRRADTALHSFCAVLR